MRIRIAGLDVGLHRVEEVLAGLEATYREFDARTDAYTRVPSNPHLCFAGCSHCCKRGAFFAVTLAEALRWALAVEGLPEPLATRVRAEADRMLALQHELFARITPGSFDKAAAAGESPSWGSPSGGSPSGESPSGESPAGDGPPGENPSGGRPSPGTSSAGPGPDRPGARVEESFSRRVAAVASTGLGCPLLEDDRCSVYANRPFLCRAYGFPVDAYAVEGTSAIQFRSLCHLYAAITLQDYVQARDLRQRLDELSIRLAGGRNLGRFTSAEAILASVAGA